MKSFSTCCILLLLSQTLLSICSSAFIVISHSCCRRRRGSFYTNKALYASTTTSTSSGGTPSTTRSSNNAIELNPLVTNVKISKTVEVFSLVKQMEANGDTVTSLCVGEPDFPPPQAVLDATIHAVKQGLTTYTAVTGTTALREAIAKDLQTRKGVTYDPVTQILVGNGAKQCVFQGILATIGQNDAAIIPAPYWPSYPEMVTLSGGTPIILETKQEDGYLINPSDLRRLLEQHESTVKLLVLCNPSNPTGGVHDAKRLQEIATVLEDFPKVVVLADEIYERLVYDELHPHVCFASLPNMMERTITVNGMSKAYAMTGYRLGYLCAPKSIAKACITIQSQITSCASSISQAAGVAALTLVSEEEMQQNVQIMKQKRDYVISQLNQMEGVKLNVVPNGAFYLLPDVSAFYNGDDTQLCIDLLKKQKLALVPGSSFGAPGTVRLSYATSHEELELAMSKLKQFLADCSP